MKSANLLCIALLTVLAGCNSSKAPFDAATTAPADAVAATPPAPAMATTAEAAATPAPAATAPAGDGRSLCAASEDIVLSCKLAGGQLASLCASKGVSDQAGYVYFAQGAAGRPDYLFPADKGVHGKRFKRTQLGFAGNSGGYAYSFEDGGRKRIFYSISGEKGVQEQGLLTASGDAVKAEAFVACEPGSLVDDIDDTLFKFTRGWDRDAAIDRGGLPAKP
ncbi:MULTISPECIES: hypothetical protein [unclassified Lysobacter]|uniref:hypothetical protein n=1 Tax=unclassified Lysobacter TaxID=2635362 RepID=UPI0006FDF2FC|nr:MULTISPECIES: hypothetical protein [unclassified Lysobacter]KQZ67816.1 hypothetical protein ASD53_00365 [Lysobacter sp. Root559]KRC38143.1 hypothetical protein ASE10_00720 [Lysobacter sp. Root76]KRD69468.1 hypothetical protein ASE45_10010 [Lysobacter sp. Root96]